MAPIAFIFFLATFLANSSSLVAHKPQIASKISVVGVVYCDTCSAKSFSKHSYFLPGVDVHIQCKFKANSPRTSEQIDFTVNRTTDNHGTYKLELSNLDGVDCIDTSSSTTSISSICQATIIKSSNSVCEIPSITSTSDQITIKSKQENHCIYSLNALSYQPRTINNSLCNSQEEEVEEKLQKSLYTSSNSYNSSKLFLPFFPPYWPYYPPFPYIPFPPFTYPQPPPSLPFPFPPIPPSPTVFRPPSPPLGFNLGDPRTWVPSLPPSSPNYIP
ncbi:Pollen Ole e 1 allergen and extensin family protein [Euphorbia peplus]|nr:Pollen Ole e 1 allergen and extensin family protein [Euphorbia peplus]